MFLILIALSTDVEISSLLLSLNKCMSLILISFFFLRVGDRIRTCIRRVAASYLSHSVTPTFIIYSEPTVGFEPTMRFLLRFCRPHFSTTQAHRHLQRLGCIFLIVLQHLSCCYLILKHKKSPNLSNRAFNVVYKFAYETT